MVIRLICLLFIGSPPFFTGCGKTRVRTAKSPATAKEVTPLPLTGALAHAVRYAEERDFAGYAKRFLQPDELERVKRSERSLDEVGRERMGDPQALIAKIRRVKVSKPNLSDDGHRAIYEREGERLVLVRVGKRWYFD